MSEQKEIPQDIKNVLDCAREAIVDAICCEDGLDGGTGGEVIWWITDILKDREEFIHNHRSLEELQDKIEEG